MRTGSSRWIRLIVVAVYAAAMAVVEAMVVYYLRRLFALQYAAVFRPGPLRLSARLPAPRADPRGGHDRHAPGRRLPGRPRPAAEARLLPVWPSAFGTSATTSPSRSCSAGRRRFAPATCCSLRPASGGLPSGSRCWPRALRRRRAGAAARGPPALRARRLTPDRGPANGPARTARRRRAAACTRPVPSFQPRRLRARNSANRTDTSTRVSPSTRGGHRTRPAQRRWRRDAATAASPATTGSSSPSVVAARGVTAAHRLRL